MGNQGGLAMKTTETKHTPGPWHTDCEICPITGSIAICANGPIVYIKDNTNGPENQKANALLIASAPAMFKALKEIANAPQLATRYTLKQIARSAIAQAQGGGE